MNENLTKLRAYPFERLFALKQHVALNAELHIDLSLGEPKHTTPGFIIEALHKHIDSVSKYPLTKGGESLRQSFIDWLVKRFNLPVGSLEANKHVLPVNGTREGLFAIAQCVIDRSKNNPLLVMPNPFYQIYEGAAYLAGATPYFVACTAENRYLPDYHSVPSVVWDNCQLVYVCSPGNPSGSVISLESYAHLLELAHRHDFIIASDECYSEIYNEAQDKPLGLLEAASQLGYLNYSRCLVFHSLSKRSNVPGLRSGFVAGDANLIQAFLRYRTYHGCAMQPFCQVASELAWQDEAHVSANRKLYQDKFDAVIAILNPQIPLQSPAASFYLWCNLPYDDEQFTLDLFTRKQVTVLPGSYLSRSVNGVNPGANHIRIALVAELSECIEAAQRINHFIQTYQAS